ncbi:hypothetical protein [Mycobacterium asiaticum]|uniref:hypothetical protein n=1 Tax=Mycobacterium asiaticum TaxID=1790 RepID=UPI0015616E64|nr:hypothetical protein [Mycobacterium asiaticum]
MLGFAGTLSRAVSGRRIGLAALTADGGGKSSVEPRLPDTCRAAQVQVDPGIVNENHIQ